ncbi:S24 family peptidase [Bacteroides nordii]|jgi:phage repressor protein C with HTH and peptisase S24 domain|uniref:S24 family peptidase n=1 Tax=Bacteroides nordii TaxID=291645 RepID=UPI00206861F8|nr:S24 family peptidase [Bacteroides nordii]DAZ20145.1 MAG TPA: hypothetical protein [Caudoviricetes sp.]
MSSIKERVLAFIKYKELNNKQFEDICGLGNGFVSKIGYSIREPKIELISNAFPELNRDWLVRGVGEMLNNVNPAPKYNEAVPIQQDVVYIPLVNQFAYAGYMEGYNDCTYLEQLPKIPFIVDKEGHGNYIAFEVKGDSMNNGTEESYLEGDRLYCREIAQHLWVSSKLHLRKWDFVIVHEDGIVVKRIIDHNVENHTITIHSLNDMYPDRILDLCDVKQIFNVIESVRPRRR